MTVIEKHCPKTGEKLGEFPVRSAEEVQEAVGRARSAFPAWRDRTLDERLKVIERMLRVLRDRGEDYSERIGEDTGKPAVDALITEVLCVGLILDHYKRRAHKILKPQKIWPGILFPGKKAHVEYFPRGVIGIISPWNFPFRLSMIPVICAIVGGNTVVLKPSEVTPLTAELIKDWIEEAGVPEGVIEVVEGDGSTGAALVDSDIDMVFFTGSEETGRKVMKAAADKPIPVELELGGKDAMIVCEDANLERTARGAVWGALLNCGQVCISVERVFVVEEIYDEFVAKLREQIEKVRVGDAPDSDIGSMTFPPQLDVLQRHVEDAVERGADLLAGGERIDRDGLWFEPTLITEVEPDMDIYKEESFGPLLPVIKVSSEEEAVRLANDHKFGLTGSVWTRDIEKGKRIASQLECGQVTINDVIQQLGNPKLPFGGVKSSGFGRYQGDEGLHTFMNTKAVMISSGRFNVEAAWFPYEDKYEDAHSLYRAVLGGQWLTAGKYFLKLLGKT